MLTIFSTHQGKVTPHQEMCEDCWINVVNPTFDDIQTLQNTYGVPMEYIHDVLDIDEMSRIEAEDDWLFIILRVPVVGTNREQELPYITIPLGLLIPKGKDFVISICMKENEPIGDLINNRLRHIDLSNRNNFILTLFLRSAIYYLRFLKDINRQTSIIEKNIETSLKSSELRLLFSYEKSLVYFMTSLKVNELLVQKLQGSRYARIGEEERDLIDDILVEHKEAIELAHIYSNIIGGMMDSFGFFISNHLNNHVKRLTSITIILMIPTLLASLYGMNVPLPIQNSVLALPVILLVSVLISGLGFYFFVKQDLF